MDHSLQLFQMDTDTYKLRKYADCAGGHTSAVSSIDMIMIDSQNKTLASGDWDGYASSRFCVVDIDLR